MADLKYERAVFALNTKVTMVPADAPVVSLPQALAALSEMYNENRAFASLTDAEGISDETVGMSPTEAEKTNADLSDVIYIADIAVNEDAGLTTFLVTRGDAKISSPAFIHRLARGVRIPEADQDELVGHSCHVVIAHEEYNALGQHRAVLEKVTNVSRTLVTRFFNALLRVHHDKQKATFKRVSGKGGSKEIGYYPRVDFTLQPSASLENDVRSGKVHSIELISRTDGFGGLDGPVHIRRSKRNLSLSVDYESQPERLINWLKEKLPSYAKQHHYDEVQINIGGLSGRRSASPTFALDQLSSAETVYARTAIVDGFDEPLQQCESSCNIAMISKLTAVLEDDTLWGPQN